MAKLEFFWDVASPYSYLATTQLAGLTERTGAELVSKPFLLGGVFKSTGNEMPAHIPAKAKFLNSDLKRWREHYAVPLLIPIEEVAFPIRSITAMRVAVAAEDRVAAMHLLMKAYWVDGIDLGDADKIGEVLTAAGHDAARLLAATQEQNIKDELRSLTDEAVERGAFGAPTMFVGDEMFWGNDRLQFVEAALTR